MSEDGYKQVATILGYPDSPGLRKWLEYIMTEEQARIVAGLPGEADELAQKLNMDVGKVKELIRDIYEKGVIVPKNFETLEGMRFIPSPIFLHDRMLAIKNWRKRLPELDKVIDEFLEKEFFPASAEQYAKAEQPAQRVLSAYKTILDSPELLPEDDVRTVLKQATTISVVPCSCRVRTGSCKRTQIDVCMQFNRSAEYGLAVGMDGLGKALTYEEALEVIDAAEDAGLIHLWGNSARMSSASLCSCCDCCCIVGLPYLEYNLPASKRYAKSRYEARVDPNICIGCSDEPSPPCIAIAPKYFKGCLRMEGRPHTNDYKAVVDPENCYGCGACVLKCPVGAIKMELVRPADHIPGIGAPKA